VIRAGVAMSDLITYTVRLMGESARYKIRAAQVLDKIGHYRTGEQFQTGLLHTGKSSHGCLEGVLHPHATILAQFHPHRAYGSSEFTMSFD
jgi:hypothetical protein